EFLTAIFPFLKVNRSQPVTSTRTPPVRVPANVHSETPRFPLMKWRAPPQWASGNVANTSAYPFRTCSRPSNLVPQTSDPALASNTQSSVMNFMSPSTSCRFQALAKASRNLAVTLRGVVVDFFVDFFVAMVVPLRNRSRRPVRLNLNGLVSARPPGHIVTTCGTTRPSLIRRRDTRGADEPPLAHDWVCRGAPRHTERFW